MTKQSGYVYSTQNLLDIPQKYQMSPFQGHKFLEQYKESRKASMQLIKDKINTTTLDQVTAQMHLNFQHPLEIINSSKFSTQKLFESIFLILLRDKDDIAITKIVNDFIKKFEIKKRIFSSYNKEIQEASNDYKTLPNYILLASICVLKYKKTKNLKYINVLLKLNDTICSQINIISENNTSFLCFFALKSELDYIFDLIKKNGIN
jgi:hypothetical protein